MIKLQTLCPKCKKAYEYANLDDIKRPISYSVTNGLFYVKCTCGYVFVPTPVAVVIREDEKAEKIINAQLDASKRTEQETEKVDTSVDGDKTTKEDKT